MKRLAIALAAATAVGLSGCSGPAADPNKTPTVTIWADATREPAATAYAELMADEVDVKVETVALADIRTKIELANQTNKGWPDVVFGLPNEVAIYADPSNGFAADLNSLVSSEVFDGYGNANDWCVIDGKAFCLKNDIAQTVLWYDTKVFDQLGLTVPTTMEEFSETALQLTGTGYVAGAIGDQGLYAGYLWSSGCPLTDVVDNSTVHIDSSAEECTRVADLLQPLLDAGVVDSRSSFDAGFISDVASKGMVAMTIGPSWFGDFVMKPAETWAIPAGQMTAAPMPSWDSGPGASGEWGGGIWVVSSHAEFPQAAADAAVYVATSTDVAKDAPTFPAFAAANAAWAERIGADDYYASDPTPAMQTQAALISPSSHPVRFDLDGTIGSVLASAISGGSSVQDAIDQFAEALKNLAPTVGYSVN